MLWIGIPNLEIVSSKQVAFHDYCELNGHLLQCVTKIFTLCFTHQWHIYIIHSAIITLLTSVKDNNQTKEISETLTRITTLSAEQRPVESIIENYNLNHKLLQIFWLYPSGCIQNVQKAIERTTSSPQWKFSSYLPSNANLFKVLAMGRVKIFLFQSHWGFFSFYLCFNYKKFNWQPVLVLFQPNIV